MKTLLALLKDACGGLRAALVAVLILLSCSGAVAWAESESESIQSIQAQAEQGDAEAQFNLGVAHDNGRGIPQDYAEAAKWYRRAAEQGHAEALTNLGVMRFLGAGIPQSYREAYVWLSLAAANGGPPAAAELLAVAAKELPTSELPAARAEINRLQAKFDEGQEANPTLGQGAGAKRKSECEDEIAALAFAQSAVEKKLKSSSGADFPRPGGGNEIITKTGECEYSIKSYADALNFLGAPVRTHFVVRLRFDKAKDAWIIRGVRLSK